MIMQFCQIFVKSPKFYVCRLVQYMIASHVGDSGEFLSNHRMKFKLVQYMVASHVGESGEYGDSQLGAIFISPFPIFTV